MLAQGVKALRLTLDLARESLFLANERLHLRGQLSDRGFPLALLGLQVGGLAPEVRRFLLQALGLAAQRGQFPAQLRQAVLLLIGLLAQGVGALRLTLDLAREKLFLTEQRRHLRGQLSDFGLPLALLGLQVGGLAPEVRRLLPQALGLDAQRGQFPAAAPSGPALDRPAGAGRRRASSDARFRR